MIPDTDWPALPYVQNAAALHLLRCALIKQRFEAAKVRRPPRSITLYVPPPLVLDLNGLWLGLANGILQRAKDTLDMRMKIADSEIGWAA